MRQSRLFGTTRKEVPSGEVSTNAELLVRAGFVDKVMAGVYTYLPLGFRVLKKIENLIRREMVAAGGQEIFMPSLHPAELWKQTGRYDTVDDLFRFTSYYTKTELVLAGTHEEIVTPLVRRMSVSYRDLPLALFQIQNKFRDEKRAKSGLLRGREFLMKDLYSFHADETDLDAYYARMKQHYKNIFDAVGIGKHTYLTSASGGTFSKYSHEFQTVTEAGEDTIYVCDACGEAINREIVEQRVTCPACGAHDLRKEQAVEVGNAFKLNTKFSAPFGLTYRARDGGDMPVLMGCYGIGLGRLLGAVVEILHDERGIMWPVPIAPFHVHLLGIGREADDVYSVLQQENIEVLYDDRDASAGEKLADADLIGCPYRAVVSERAGDRIEVKNRGGTQASVMTVEELIQHAS